MPVMLIFYDGTPQTLISQVGYSGINVTGGVRRIFLGLKFSTAVFSLGLRFNRVFFWV